MKGFQPNLSLTYNSQQGNSVVGVGWSISGLPSISRGGKSIYYDGKTQGVSLDNNDSFVLDGIRYLGFHPSHGEESPSIMTARRRVSVWITMTRLCLME